MRIVAELVNRRGYERQCLDVDLKIEATDAEKALLTASGVPYPGDGRGSSQDLFRTLYTSQGELYRECGVRNYRVFQPDASNFSNSSAGWVKFISMLSTEATRDDMLKRVVQSVAGKMKLIVHKMVPASFNIDITLPNLTDVPVDLGTLQGQFMDVRIGDKIYRCAKIEEVAPQTKLVQNAISEIKEQAQGKVGEYQAECTHNLALMRKQYEKQMTELQNRYANILPAPEITNAMLLEQVQYVANPQSQRHAFFIPIHLQFKYIDSGHGSRWELQKQYQLKQDGILRIDTDRDLHVCYGMIYNLKLEDTIQFWHYSGGGICWGSYSPQMKVPDDIIKIRNDIQVMLETIGKRSLGRRNLNGTQLKLNEHIDNCPSAPDGHDYDMSAFAKQIGVKGKNDVWEAV